MSKIKLTITGCMGRMGKQLAKSSRKDKSFKICFISLLLSFGATIYPSVKATKVEPINLIKWD